MKKLLLILYIFSFPSYGIDFPKQSSPPHLVNDFAGMLQQDEVQQLEYKLVAFNDSTSIQIAVITVNTLDGYPIDDYAFQLAKDWGIGQQKTSNGVLLLISKEERNMFIATGYGMEGIMPDALCKRIITNDITPYFKQQQYFEGIDNGTTQMMLLAKGEYKGSGRSNQKPFPFFAIGIGVLIFFLVIVFRIRSTRSYASLNNVPFWVAWGILNAASSRQSGRWSDFSRGSGGFGGGSSSGGGGFGGFGGGSFGGGGAGGSW
ncbi:MAG: TPM domain-containing protein [Bacteroidota bacterium]